MLLGRFQRLGVGRIKRHNMMSMFDNENVSNGDISMWDVSGVTGMGGRFTRALAYGGDISKWDVSRVTSMQGMFFEAGLSDGNLSKWDVFFATYMIVMFARAQLFDGVFSKQVKNASPT